MEIKPRNRYALIRLVEGKKEECQPQFFIEDPGHIKDLQKGQEVLIAPKRDTSLATDNDDLYLVPDEDIAAIISK